MNKVLQWVGQWQGNLILPNFSNKTTSAAARKHFSAPYSSQTAVCWHFPEQIQAKRRSAEMPQNITVCFFSMRKPNVYALG
jgi:hypothetical protein